MAEPIGIPPTSVTDVTAEYDGYWLALGRFIHAFADIERHMQLLLWIETGVEFRIARAIFSGTRIDVAKSYINRSREAKGLPKDEELARAFAQLAVIANARNDIVHFGAEFDGTAFNVSNVMLAHIPARERSFPVSPTVLRTMTDDLEIIKYALDARMLELMAATPSALGQVHATADAISAARLGARAPWRYKQAPPSHAQKPARTPPGAFEEG